MITVGFISNIADKKGSLVYTVVVKREGLTLEDAKSNVAEAKLEVARTKRDIARWTKATPNKEHSGREIAEMLGESKADLKQNMEYLADELRALERVKGQGQLTIGSCQIMQEQVR
jgi:biotin operon repressor